MAQRTIAQAMLEEGAVEGRRDQAAKMLLKQLSLRFGEIPAYIEQAILATRDLALLEQWQERVVVVDSLDEIGIGAAE